MPWEPMIRIHLVIGLPCLVALSLENGKVGRHRWLYDDRDRRAWQRGLGSTSRSSSWLPLRPPVAVAPPATVAIISITSSDGCGTSGGGGVDAVAYVVLWNTALSLIQPGFDRGC